MINTVKDVFTHYVIWILIGAIIFWISWHWQRKDFNPQKSNKSDKHEQST